MKKKLPLTNKSGQVRELTWHDIQAMRPGSEVLPADLVAALSTRKAGQQGIQK
jgi:hypothetical protein